MCTSNSSPGRTLDIVNQDTAHQGRTQFHGRSSININAEVTRHFTSENNLCHDRLYPSQHETASTENSANLSYQATKNPKYDKNYTIIKRKQTIPTVGNKNRNKSQEKTRVGHGKCVVNNSKGFTISSSQIAVHDIKLAIHQALTNVYYM